MRYGFDDSEEKYARRCDARTLAEAEQIKANKDRYQFALLAAKEIAQEEVERVKGIAKVAGVKVPSVPKDNNVSSEEQTFNKRGYRNPATIGRL